MCDQDLYMLCDVQSDEHPLVASYCDSFSIPTEVARLAMAVYSIDHNTLLVQDAQVHDIHVL